MIVTLKSLTMLPPELSVQLKVSIVCTYLHRSVQLKVSIVSNWLCSFFLCMYLYDQPVPVGGKGGGNGGGWTATKRVVCMYLSIRMICTPYVLNWIRRRRQIVRINIKKKKKFYYSRKPP